MGKHGQGKTPNSESFQGKVIKICNSFVNNTYSPHPQPQYNKEFDVTIFLHATLNASEKILRDIRKWCEKKE